MKFHCCSFYCLFGGSCHAVFLTEGLIALEDNPLFQVSKNIKICRDQNMFNAEQSSEGRRLPLNQAKLIQILKNDRQML